MVKFFQRFVRRSHAVLVLFGVLLGAVPGSFIAAGYNSLEPVRYVSSIPYVPSQTGGQMRIMEPSPQLASWFPQLDGVKIVPLESELQIPEQANMFSQLVITDVDVITLEKIARAWLTARGFRISNTAVNEWGADAAWVRGLHLSAMKVGEEVSITLSAIPPNLGTWPEGYKSGMQMWRSARPDIRLTEVQRYRGYGEGFLPLESAL